jgi:hypothetical protein
MVTFYTFLLIKIGVEEVGVFVLQMGECLDPSEFCSFS